jgi:hypothetical protein
MNRLKLSDFKLMFVMLGVFAAVAVGFWQAFGNIFYLYNFTIIGVSVGLGMGLWPLLGRERKPWARRLSRVFQAAAIHSDMNAEIATLAAKPAK